MPFVFGTSSDYQAFADIMSRVAIGTSLHAVSAIAAGGTGYTVGDVLTVSGGTSTIAATLEVLAVSSGVITSVRIRNAGLYTATPANDASVTGGTGSGAQFTLTWDTNGWIRRRATNVAGAAQSAAIAAGGTGYTLGDTLTLSGGTFGSAATFTVTGVSGGVVTSVSVLYPGDYTTTPGNPASTTGGTGTGCTLNVTYGGTGEREIILEGEGGGSDEIIVGYRTFFDASSGARNLLINGFTGFDAGLTYENQPGRSPGLNTAASGADQGGAYMLLGNTTINWWISVTTRRIISVARVSNCYSNAYMGFINAFATGGEYPYPLLVSGTSTERFQLPSTSTITSSGMVDPIKDIITDNGPVLLRDPAGVWRSVFNSSSSVSRAQNTTGLNMAPGGVLTGVTRGDGDDWYTVSDLDGSDFIPQSGIPGTQLVRLVPTEAGSDDLYVRWPATVIWSDGSTPGGIYGELDGAFWFEANLTVVAENRLRDGDDFFTVFQMGTRTDSWALWCLRED